MLSNKFRKSLVVESALLAGVICIILLICCPNVWTPIFDRLDQESAVATGSIIDLLEQADQKDEQLSQADAPTIDQSSEPGVFEADPVPANELEEFVPLTADQFGGETVDSELIMLDEEPTSAVRFSDLPRSPMTDDAASMNELNTRQMPQDKVSTQGANAARNEPPEHRFAKPTNTGLFQSNTFVVEKDQSNAGARAESARNANSAAFSDFKPGTDKRNWRSNPWVEQPHPDQNATEALDRNRIDLPSRSSDLNSTKFGPDIGRAHPVQLSVRPEASSLHNSGSIGFVKNRFVEAPVAPENRVAEQRIQSERPAELPAANSVPSSNVAKNADLEPESIPWDSEIQR